MEIVDEPITPGCPQCAVKHLSAALWRLQSACRRDPRSAVPVPSCPKTRLAQALVNLVEAAEGYESHYETAIGLLAAAEEDWLCGGPEPAAERARRASDVRNVRVALMRSRFDMSAMAWLAEELTDADLMWGHLSEARREFDVPFLSSPDTDVLAAQICAAIRSIREEYFPEPNDAIPVDASPLDDTESAGKGGEIMATKKTPNFIKKGAEPKKADAKAAKAGKGAKACAKGGKCKK